MRVITLATTAAAALVASTIAAFAVADTGTITAVNWTIGTITLDNGHTYIVPPSLQQTFPLAIGVKVKIDQEDAIVRTISKA